MAAIGRDVCQALAAVHDAGLLHRDIKAQNVIRESGGRVVLMDFGTGREPAGSVAGEDGVAVGTPLSAAPELFSGASCEVATEIYSVGVLLFHLATGTYPVTGRTVSEIREAHGGVSTTASQPQSPAATAAVPGSRSGARGRNPNDRYRDVRQLAWALETVGRNSQRLRRAASWMGLGVVVMAASFFAMSSGSSPATRRPGPEIPLPVGGDTVSGMALSPDGSRLAYIARVNGADELIVRSLDQFTAVTIHSATGLTHPFFLAGRPMGWRDRRCEQHAGKGLD